MSAVDMMRAMRIQRRLMSEVARRRAIEAPSVDPADDIVQQNDPAPFAKTARL